MTRPLSAKQEAFAQAIAKYGRTEKVKAYKEAGYSITMKQSSISCQADRVYNKPNVSQRIDELVKVVEKVVKDKFTVTVEQRLRMLDRLINEGFKELPDAQGVMRCQNLPVVKSSIDTLNVMLGTSEDSGKTKPVKVFVGVQDASRK